MLQEINFTPITAFENYQIMKIEDGHVLLETQVVASSLNYYGQAHGGYLFTLCDQVSGLVVISQGQDAVTAQSSINYLKGAQEGDLLIVEGTCLHKGRTTRMVEVVIKRDQDLICKASFTMFVTGEHKQ